ncbi:MAG: hypothetical protein FJZ08_05275, partial [Candidatus Omnitrophica bacterium]|nr:hypothetical protein [Candidatus Omnitrophota bacterium]
MFKALKLYKRQNLDLEDILKTLVEFGYKRQDSVGGEGDFARRGGIVDIFPFTFELPIRLELDIDQIAAIRTFNTASGAPLWEHSMVIILPVKKPSHTRTVEFKEEFPIENFVD